MTKQMKNILNLEEFGQLLLSIYLFSQMDYAWWVYPALILLPDLSMLGYLFNSEIGAWLYNVGHHKLLAILFLAIGFILPLPWMALTGVILFGHSAMDRIFGYGLKYSDDFKNTHLGWIGKGAGVES